MAFKKNSADAIERFDALAHVPGGERGLLFGCPVYKLGTQRYATLFENSFAVLLSEKDRAAAIKGWLAKAAAFARSG